MNAEIPEMPKFPKIDVLPLVDRVISAGLWVGRLVTRRFGHNPPSHGDHFRDVPNMVLPEVIPPPDHSGELPTHQDFDYTPKGW